MPDSQNIQTTEEANSFGNWLMRNYLWPFTVDTLIGFKVINPKAKPEDPIPKADGPRYRFNGPAMSDWWRRWGKENRCN